jgi:riboflavin-specific deaminase-like protein
VQEIVEGIAVQFLREAAAQALSPTSGADSVRAGADPAPAGSGPGDRPSGSAAGRPYLALNMVSTADGRATVDGRSGPIGNAADRELFHGLRTTADAVMAGAGTIRVERYRRLVRDEQARARRRARGLDEEPLACIVSGRLDLSPELPILADPHARVAILTASAASLPVTQEGARIDYIRAIDDGVLDLPAALSELHERFGVRTVMCEGGPHLNSHLLANGLVDELFLSLSPKLAGGDPSGEALRIVSGPELEPLVELDLISAYEHDSHLFLRYRVRRAASGQASQSAGQDS